MSGVLDCSIKAQTDRTEAAKLIASNPSLSSEVANDLNKLNAMCQKVPISKYQKGGPVNVPPSTGPHAVYTGISPPVTSINQPIAPAEPLDLNNMPVAPPPTPKKEFAVFRSNPSSKPVTTIGPIPHEPEYPLE